MAMMASSPSPLRRRRRAGRRLVLAVLAGLPPAAALGAESAPVALSGAEVRLVSGTVTGSEADAGIEIRLAPNWKTYWRYPGDSGVPPQIDWSRSRNVAKVAVEWPAPKRFSDGGGGYSIGYKGTVLFPLKVTFVDPGRPAQLNIALDFAICEVLCMPASAAMSLDLAPGEDAGAAARIAAARAKVPAEQAVGAPDTPAVLGARIDRASTPPRLVVEARVATSKADLFAEGPDDRWALPLAQKTALPDGRARFVIPLDGVPPEAAVEGTPLDLTLVDMPRSIVSRVTVAE